MCSNVAEAIKVDLQSSLGIFLVDERLELSFVKELTHCVEDGGDFDCFNETRLGLVKHLERFAHNCHFLIIVILLKDEKFDVSEKIPSSFLFSKHFKNSPLIYFCQNASHESCGFFSRVFSRLEKINFIYGVTLWSCGEFFLNDFHVLDERKSQIVKT